jgi:uncharacterized protein (DUF433 family)
MQYRLDHCHTVQASKKYNEIHLTFGIFGGRPNPIFEATVWMIIGMLREANYSILLETCITEWIDH